MQMHNLEQIARSLACSRCGVWRRDAHVVVFEPCDSCAEHEFVVKFFQGEPPKQRPRAAWKAGKIMHEAQVQYGLEAATDWQASYVSKHGIPAIVMRWTSVQVTSPRVTHTALLPDWVSTLLGKGIDIQRAGKRTKVPWKWPEILQMARDDEGFRDALLVMCEMDDSESRIATVADFLLSQWDVAQGK